MLHSLLESLKAVFSVGSSVLHGPCHLWIVGLVGLAATALILVLAAVGLLPVILHVLALPKPAELQRLNEELQISQARFAGILDIASDAIISIDRNQRITLFNQAAEKVFGYTTEEALGQPLELLLPQRFAALHHQHVSNFKEQNGNTRRMGDRSEIFGRRKDGSEFPAEASISKLEVAGEKIFTAFLRDITDRKQVEAELQAQQQFLRQVIDADPTLIFVKDWDGKFTLANQALAEVYNTTIEEIIGKTDVDFCGNPADPEQYAQADRQVMQTLQPMLGFEETFTSTEGQVRYFQSTKKPLLSPDGQTRYVLGVANDITNLKQTEAALQQKTEELEAFFSSAIDLLCIANIDGHFLRLNPEWEQTLGYSLSELQGKCFLDFVHPDDLNSTLAAISQLSEQQLILNFTNRYRHQDGSYRWIEWRSVPRGEYIYAAARDITERKRAEEELRLSQEQLQLALEASGEGLWDWQIDTGKVYRSSAYLQILGYDIEDFPNQVAVWEQCIHPDDRDRVLACLNAHLQDISMQFACEYRMQVKSGEWKWIADYGKVVTCDAQGKPLRMIGTHRDISDRKRIEQEREQTKIALQESEERFQAFMNHNPTAAWITDENGRLLYVNSTYSRLFKLPQNYVPGSVDCDIHPAEFAQQYLQNIRQVATTKQVLETVEPALRPDGTLGECLVYKFPISEVKGQCLVGGIAIDITERKRIGKALQEREEQLQLAFEASGDGLWDWNIATGEVYFSPRFSEMLGYAADELPHKVNTWKKLIHPDDMPWVKEIWTSHLKSNSTSYAFDYRLQSKSGEWKWISDYGKVVRWDEDGKPLRVIGLHRDISDRKQAEAQIQASLKEKEILLKEIHHRVKNNLQIIYSLLRLQCRTLKDPQALQSLLDSQGRIESIALVHEKLYRAGNLATVNFAEYIPGLIANLISSYNTQAKQIALETAIEPITLDIDKAVPCGLIINELISNCLKYAFPAQDQGIVYVSMHVDDLSYVTLTVRDNGVGLPPSFNLAQTNSLGLQLVQDFVDQLKGTMTIDCFSGTAFNITFPGNCHDGSYISTT